VSLPLFCLAASLFLGFFAPQGCDAQDAGASEAAGYFSSPIPLSYQADEEKKEIKKESSLRRGLIIAAGSFPFSYFYTNLAFDLVRYAANGFDSLYAPWPFRSLGTVSIDSKETFIRIGVGAGLSLAIGLAGILGK
jgi:hypothetical protein